MVRETAAPIKNHQETQPDNGEAENHQTYFTTTSAVPLTVDSKIPNNKYERFSSFLESRVSLRLLLLVVVSTSMAIVIFALSMSILAKNNRYEKLMRTTTNQEEYNIKTDYQAPGFPNEEPCPLVFFAEEGLLLKNGMIEMDGCSSNKIVSILRDAFDEAAATAAISCPWDFNYDLLLRTRTYSKQKAVQYLDKLCEEAEQVIWNDTPRKKWTEHVDPNLTPSYLRELLVEGGTDLNLLTGNLQNADGTDPRTNDNYPTDELSFQVGRSVRSYYEQYGTSTILVQEPSFDVYDNCQLQTIMCCYGRDRQYGDNNGDCKANDCLNASPADNTNVCYHNEERYPGGDEQESIHCHGFAWSGNTTDPSYRLRFNSMFHSFFYDHWYTRGYVESIRGREDDDDDAAPPPMCHCIEKMPAVVRADCTEAHVRTKYHLNVVSSSSSDDKNKREQGAIEIVPGPLKVNFRSCRGAGGNNNDLASKIEQLNLDGQLDTVTKATLFEQYLVGYDSPNDNDNEAACETVWIRKQEQQNNPLLDDDTLLLPSSSASASASPSKSSCWSSRSLDPQSWIIVWWLSPIAVGLAAIIHLY
jgi:hypothetical protein